MKQEKNNNNTYAIIGRTNGWIASRDAKFNGKTEIIIEKGLSLKEANNELLNMFNNDYETSFTNWGIAQRLKRCPTIGKWSDGTRYYEYDSRTYEIIKEETEEQ